MKNILAPLLIILSVAVTSCVTTTPQRSSTGDNSSVRVMSLEAQARKKTEDMATTLSLSANQKDDVMVANTVYLKLLKNLTDNNETSKIDAAKQSYMNKLKTILTTEQYSKFENEMGG